MASTLANPSPLPECLQRGWALNARDETSPGALRH